MWIFHTRYTVTIPLSDSVSKTTWNSVLVHRRGCWRVLAACWYIESRSGGVLAACWYIESSPNVAHEAEKHKETISINRLPLLVTDMSKVSIGKTDSRTGLMTVRTSIKGDRGVLRCDTPKMVRPHVTTRREITKLEVSSSSHIRNQMF